MRKIILTIFLLLILTSSGFAKSVKDNPDPNLTFVYINGSNNNDQRMRDWYINGVTRLHPAIKKKFEKDETINQWTKNQKLVIKNEPTIFFWGYDSKTDLEYVKDMLAWSKATSSLLAYEVRSLMTQFLHDAIWVQKDHNMLPILDSLNEQLKDLAAQDQNVILYGYSAGSFVTYQYMVYKFPYIKMDSFFRSLNVSDDFLKFVQDNPQQKTCLSAMLHDKGNLGVLSSEGKFILNQNEIELKNNYLNMDKMTNMYCAPQNRVKGIVNFASPLPLFYSDIADESYELTFYTRYMYKYVMENGIYFLTLNFGEDPLGFPTNRNLTINQMQDILSITFNNPSGVIYDNSKIWSRRFFPFAHTSYWSARIIFPKAIVKSFVDGTKFLYDDEFQKKMLKKMK